MKGFTTTEKDKKIAAHFEAARLHYQRAREAAPSSDEEEQDGVDDRTISEWRKHMEEQEQMTAEETYCLYKILCVGV